MEGKAKRVHLELTGFLGKMAVWGNRENRVMMGKMAPQE